MKFTQEIVNAITLIKVCKAGLQSTRENGWHILLNEVSLFYEKQNIRITNMDNSIFTFAEEKLIRLTMFYPIFFQVELMVLGSLFETFIIDL